MKPLRVYTKGVFFQLYDISEKQIESLRKKGAAIVRAEFGYMAFNEEGPKSFLKRAVSKNDFGNIKNIECNP